MADIETKLEAGAYGKNARVSSPTMGIRWMNGKLQQAWLITQCGEVNQPIERRIEWREVPDESQPVPNGDL